MAAGVPVVADEVGSAESTIEGGGYVVRDDNHWTEALLALAQDEELRSRLGRAGRRRAVANYSVERWARPLAALIEGESCSRRPQLLRRAYRLKPSEMSSRWITPLRGSASRIDSENADP